MAKDEDAIAKSAISIPVSQILIYGFATLFIGLAGHLLATPEQVGADDNILPVLMLLHSNWFVAALVMAAAIAAGISTINAMLLVSSPDRIPGPCIIKQKGKISDKQNMLYPEALYLLLQWFAELWHLTRRKHWYRSYRMLRIQDWRSWHRHFYLVYIGKAVQEQVQHLE